MRVSTGRGGAEITEWSLVQLHRKQQDPRRVGRKRGNLKASNLRRQSHLGTGPVTVTQDRMALKKVLKAGTGQVSGRKVKRRKEKQEQERLQQGR